MNSISTRQNGRHNGNGLRALGVAVASALVLALPQTGFAKEFDTGNPDLRIRWDNTIRTNFSTRVSNQDQAILNNVNVDDADRNFDDETMFTRIDLLTEFDLIWKRQMGFRVSAAGWWDGAYSGLDNDSVQTSNRLVDGQPALGLDSYTRRYGKGPSGEILDGFVFGNFAIGDTPINMKLGQTTVYWGESLLLNGAIHGVSYSQNPLDLWKGLATPGAEAKELFQPRMGFNVQSQVTDDLSVAAQYFFNWRDFKSQAYRYPEAGSYLSPADYLLWGADSLIVGANPFAPMFPGSPQYLRAWHGDDITPDKSKGNYGLALRWSPDWAAATFGAYYRRTFDMQPQAVLTPGLANVPSPAVCQGIGGIPLAPTSPTPCIINPDVTNPTDLTTNGKFGEYGFAFGKDIDIFGLSFSKNIFGLSVGAELSYRDNMPLISDPVTVLPAPLVPTTPGAIATTDVPDDGTPGARGTTMHGLVNVIGIINKTPFWDTANWAAELTWMRWMDVNDNEAVFKGRDGYNAIDAVDRNYFGLGINFTPTWFQVFPGVDILAPLSWSQGIKGNAAVTSGGNEDAGTFGVGLAADIYQKYRLDLKYVGFYGDYTKVDGVATTFSGVTSTLSDRDFLAFTFKVTF